MTSPLTQMQCVPCRGGEPALTPAEWEEFLPQIPDWEVVEDGDFPLLRQVFTFKDYLQAAAFVQRLAELAEANDHHPAILLEWRQVTVSWWTHVVNGLHQNDFISAAQTDQLYTPKV